MRKKVAIKDVKMRTFIIEDTGRNENGAARVGWYSLWHRWNLTRIIGGTDDSMLRGTTLKGKSIIVRLARLKPKRLWCVISPQIRYHDCYGIRYAQEVGFPCSNAEVELLKEVETWLLTGNLLTKGKGP